MTEDNDNVVDLTGWKVQFENNIEEFSGDGYAWQLVEWGTISAEFVSGPGVTFRPVSPRPNLRLIEGGKE